MSCSVLQRRAACAVVSAQLLVASTMAFGEGERIEDNSFLIEEAYNQEDRVVQHISFAQWDPDERSWDYSFTQEWPVVSQLHQFSYTVPVTGIRETGPLTPGSVPANHRFTGLGDVLLNYRYQLIRREGLAFSPRISVILPTAAGSRAGDNASMAYQMNLPVSFDLAEKLVMHVNLGATYQPRNRAPDGSTQALKSYTYGASLIYLARANFNLMLESYQVSQESALGGRATERHTESFVSPGMRFAINFESGLQIVPGIAYPVGLGASSGSDQWIAYLSFEHPF